MVDRVQHIDIAKGISISLVAMFHSDLKYTYPEIIDPMALLRMPLFFFLSGIFFSWLASPKDFLLRKSEALLKPYFSVLLVLFIISFLSGDDALAWQLKGIFYGNGNTISWTPLWFLTHLFVVYCFSYVTFRFANFSKFRDITLGIISLLFILLGSVWIDLFWQRDICIISHCVTISGLPFSLDIVLITSAYFMVGWLLKLKATNFYPKLSFFILSLTIFIFVSQFTNTHIDLNNRVYDYPIYATFGAVSGIYIVMSISYLISKSNWLSFIPLHLGKASLYILIFHSVIYTKSFGFFSDRVSDENTLLYLSIFSFGLSITIPLFIKWIVENSDILSLAFLPFKSNKLLQRTLYARR